MTQHTSGSDKAFTGSIPRVYETYLVPLLFEAYAVDLAKRLAKRAPARVLEIAAGTGVVTRAMAGTLPASTTIVATDLNQAMLDQAAATWTGRPIEWRPADATQLPFPDNSFDAVVCQFGVMFFPDKPKAYAEAKRVLQPGGAYIFNVWDSVKENDFADVITSALAERFPTDPPGFLARTPYGYHDQAAIRRDLAAGGFDKVAQIETVIVRGRSASARDVAIGHCEGTPLGGEIGAKHPGKLDEAIEAATAAVTKRFGTGPVEGTLRAHVVVVEK